VCWAVEGVYHYVTLQISEKVCQVKCEPCAINAGKIAICNLQTSNKYLEYVCIIGRIFFVVLLFSFHVSVRKPHELLLSLSECSLAPTFNFTDATSATAQLGS
jgi:hypothetical protein